MVTDFRTLASDELLAQAARRGAAGFQQDFPVLDGGRLVGVLTRSDALAALADGAEGSAVKDVMQVQVETGHPAEILDSILARMQEGQCHTLAVVRDGHLVGLLTLDHVGEFLAVQAARRVIKWTG
jgi:CBS domain-containing protein